MNNKDNLVMSPSVEGGVMVADEVSVPRDFEVRLTAVETELKHVAKKSEVSEIKEANKNLATKSDIAEINASIAAINVNIARINANMDAMNENMATKADLEMLKADIERNNTRIENLKFWVVSSVLGGIVTFGFLFFAYYEIFGGKQ